MFSWLKRRARRRLLREPFPDQWRPHLERVRLYTLLSPEDRRRLEDSLRIIIAEKHWEECGGMKISDEVKVVIAALASIPLLNLRHAYYRNVMSILVYPDTFKVPNQQLRGGGIVQEGSSATLGLASLQGPVVLAWDAVRRGNENAEDGRNVVLHEFAHKLDMLDRFADGAPPLGSRQQYRAWARIMTEEFDGLKEQARKGRRTLLDKYGATNPAEFFAVATEHFFEQPRQMQRKHEPLYGLLVDYYRQDPAGRLLDSGESDS
jgi:Mlc titration factor MtfA (ptsG expression regulator)